MTTILVDNPVSIREQTSHYNGNDTWTIFGFEADDKTHCYLVDNNGTQKSISTNDALDMTRLGNLQTKAINVRCVHNEHFIDKKDTTLITLASMLGAMGLLFFIGKDK
jgi:hypothetical protein